MKAHRLLLLWLAACAAPPTGETPDAPITAAPRSDWFGPSAPGVHRMLAYGSAPASDDALSPDGILVFPPIPTLMPFNEVVPSWNIELPDGAGFRAEVLVMGFSDGAVSPWYDLGTWGVAPDQPAGPTSDELGAVDVDVFRSQRTFDAIGLRFVRRPSPDGKWPHLKSALLCVSNTTGDPEIREQYGTKPEVVAREGWQRRLEVPFRSQKSEDPALAGRICSPTSVAMVMAWYGVERPTADLAARVYDAEHDIYGGWARAVQAAFEEGVPGCVTRFSSLEELYWHIAEGRPVIASIHVRDGELRGAPYRSTEGHLIVITGFDAEGNVHVNDPAGVDPAHGVVTYPREDLQRVWIDRGGVAYLLSRPGS